MAAICSNYCRSSIFLLVVLWLFTPVIGWTQSQPAWQQPTSLSLTATFADGQHQGSWQFENTAGGHTRILSRQYSVDGTAENYECLLLQRRILTCNGIALDSETPGSAIDAPVLMLQLGLNLLAAAFPQAPLSYTEEVQVELPEQSLPLRLQTATAEGAFPAPWSVAGILAPGDERQRHFRLAFRFGPEQQGLQLEGDWRHAARAPVLDGETSLSGWNIVAIDSELSELLEDKVFENLDALLGVL